MMSDFDTNNPGGLWAILLALLVVGGMVYAFYWGSLMDKNRAEKDSRDPTRIALNATWQVERQQTQQVRETQQALELAQPVVHVSLCASPLPILMGFMFLGVRFIRRKDGNIQN